VTLDPGSVLVVFSDGLFEAIDGAGIGYGFERPREVLRKAALVSVIEPDRTPAQVLQRVDRVLRTSLTMRQFTTLCLIRLDPRAGTCLLANAGHPFPLVYAAGKVEEVVVPGLPLGQGPDRAYRDHTVTLDPGSVLVVFSDGLFEAIDGAGIGYGFERPREVLRKAARWRAGEVLEMLLADWRRHVGPGSPADDTTVLVLKRND